MRSRAPSLGLAGQG